MLFTSYILVIDIFGNRRGYLDLILFRFVVFYSRLKVEIYADNELIATGIELILSNV